MPRYIGASNTAAIAAGANFTAGNQSKGSLYDFLKSMGGEKGCLLYTSPSPRDS